MKFLPIVLIILSIFFMSCKIQYQELIGKWTHAYEKDHDNLQVYVKGEDPALPPARFRQVFIFQEDNICKYGKLAANDQHGKQEGTYTLKDKTLTILDESGTVKFKFKVISIAEELLELKKLK